MATADPFEHGLLPAQFLSDRSIAPEQRLWLATLLAALRSVCAGRVTVRRPAPLEDDLAWFASEDDTPPFTFLAICRMFAIDPTRLRAFVARHAGSGFVIRNRAGGIASRHEQPSVQPFKRYYRHPIRRLTEVA